MPNSSRHTAPNIRAEIRRLPSDYDEIRKENEREYGTGIERWGEGVLVNRYGKRAHFIYELLQNTEDALSRRTDSHERRGVFFDLTSAGLRVSHFGVPFNEEDVRGVCGIGESTKDLTEIGRFGIGFKSVFAFTERPEIHSGPEAFAIESYVRPSGIVPLQKQQDETIIVVPFSEGDDASKNEIADALSRLGTLSLLFLREVEEISWSIDGDPFGLYLRHAVQKGANVRRVTIVGEKLNEPDVDDEWLVFSRPVHTEGGETGGYVEIAWWTETDEDARSTIRPVINSPLVVYFPTVVETHLGFLINGPYRTTPNRDNVPERDKWNQTCVEETGVLLIESLRWLRDHGFLDATTLSCLPMDSGVFEESMFHPLLKATTDALATEELLPTACGLYASGDNSRIGRTEELRELLSPDQLASLEGHTMPLSWLDGTISQNRTRELHDFLVRELGIQELTPGAFLRRLTVEFLEQQTDEWTDRLYKFLGTQGALRQQVESFPIIRLSDGSHVLPWADDMPQAFLPGSTKTSFSTVRVAVCQTEEAREFLESLGLAEPDPVDDVILNVLPKYSDGPVAFSETEYSEDVDLILAAAETDSRSERDKLNKALSDAPWVRAVDGTGRSRLWKEPRDLYLATERLQQLFQDIPEVYLVDNAIACLKGEEIRGLLERAGASRTLKTVEVPCDLSTNELTKIRRNTGLEPATSWKLTDLTIRELDPLLDKLAILETAERRERSGHLWDALGELETRGRGAFECEYVWRYSHQTMTASIDSAFVRLLNKYHWVPDSSGELRPPGSVFFEQTEWKRNRFLESKIIFKPDAMSRLAKEAGLESGVVELLQEMGLTSLAELQATLGLNDDGGSPEQPEDRDAQHMSEDLMPTTTNEETMNGDSSDETVDADDVQARRPSPKNVRPRQLFTYVGVVPETKDDTDPDGLEFSQRMDLESSAIEFILDGDSSWQRTKTNNPGFDLFRGPTIDTATHWCEVKAMTGTLDDRPVGMSSTQFEYAQSRGDAYWLYVVERAGTERANLVPIQDPAGKAKTFTFDRGWRYAVNNSDADDSGLWPSDHRPVC